MRSSAEIFVDQFGNPTIQSEGNFEMDAADIEAKESLLGSSTSRRSRSLLTDIDIDRSLVIKCIWSAVIYLIHANRRSDSLSQPGPLRNEPAFSHAHHAAELLRAALVKPYTGIKPAISQL